MTEFILVITEFYTPITDGLNCSLQWASCWFSLLGYFLHTLILYLTHTLYALWESDLWQKKSEAHFLAWLFPWKCLNKKLNLASGELLFFVVYLTNDRCSWPTVATLHIQNPLNCVGLIFFPPLRFVKSGKAFPGYPCECDLSGLIFRLFLPRQG